MKGKLCEVCGRPAVKEQSVFDDEGTDSYYCSQECKRYSTWKAKIIVGGLLAFIGLITIATIPIVGLILIAGGGVAGYIGYNDSKIIITTGRFANQNSSLE